MTRVITIIAAGLLVLGAPCWAQEGVTEASVSVSGTNARTSADLSTGWKTVYCTAAAFYRMGTSTATATTSDEPIPANTHWLVLITNEARRLAFITSGGTGTCSIYPRNVVGTRLLPPLPALLPNVNGIAISPTNITMLASDAVTPTGTISNWFDSGIAIQPVSGGALILSVAGAGSTLLDAQSIQIGTSSATSMSLGNVGATMALNASGISINGGASTITGYITGTVAVTGASVTAGNCANQGSAITETGAVAGDACFLGLSASPGNGLAYSCVTGSNSCQIVACNASAGNLTSLTGTHRCTVIH